MDSIDDPFLLSQPTLIIALDLLSSLMDLTDFVVGASEQESKEKQTLYRHEPQGELLLSSQATYHSSRRERYGVGIEIL